MEEDPFAERKYIKRREAEGFWQFQFEREPLPESESFYDKKYGSKLASFLAARAYRDEYLKSAQDLGIVSLDDLHRGAGLYLALSARNTSGIIGVHRQTLPRQRMRIPEMNWIANYKDEHGKQNQRRFSVKALGERGALVAAIRFRRDFVTGVSEAIQPGPRREAIEKHLEDLDLLAEYIEAIPDDQELFLFLGSLSSETLPTTEKEAILAIRIGQARFRRLVLAIWQGQCAVTGATQFLTAGHIKPWSIATDQERLDPYNGIALSPVYDKAFDAGLITFEKDGSIRVSSAIRLNAPLLGITGRERIHGLSEPHLKYLEFHRATRFRDEA